MSQPSQSPILVHNAGHLSLCFQPDEIQSQMREDAPDELVLPYTQAVAAFLLLNPSPRHILTIGLGGGSIPKWCFRTLPHARITTVEIDPRIIALRDHFHIPPDDHRFRILQQDGAAYLAAHHPHTDAGPDARPDILIIDAFGPSGQPRTLCTPAFYQDCQRHLSPNGILIVNLCDPLDNLYISRIRHAFSGRIFVATFATGQNKVVFAANPLAPSLAPLASRLHGAPAI